MIIFSNYIKTSYNLSVETNYRKIVIKYKNMTLVIYKIEKQHCNL